MNFKEQLNAVKLNKIPMKNQLNNNIKPKMNSKKEEIEKEINLLKTKKGLKSDNLKNSNNNEKEIKPQAPKKLEQKVGGFKNLKDMIEQKMKRQRVMSTDNVKK